MEKRFTYFKTMLLVAFLVLGIAGNLNAQTIVPIGAGSPNKTIQTAYDAIKSAAVSTPITGAYVLELQGDYDPTSGTTLETFPITLNAINGASATNSITIRPATSVSKTLTMSTSVSDPITSISTSAAASTTTKFMTSSTQLLKDMKIAGYGINGGGTGQTTVTDITDGVVTINTNFSWNASYNGAYSTMIACPSAGTITKVPSPTNINSTTLDYTTSSFPAGIVAGMIVGGNAIQSGTAIVSVAASPTAGKTRVVISKALVSGNQTTPTLYCTAAATGIYVTPTGFQLPVSSILGLNVGMNVAGALVGVGSTVVKVGTTDVYTSLGGTFTSGTALTFTTPNALNPAIKFDGAKYVTIDGQSGGAGGIKNLTLSNTLTYSNASTLYFVNDASYNTIKYCNVLGSSTSITPAPATGTIFIGTTTGTTARAGSFAAGFTGSGNLYNTVDNCTIADATGGFPSVGVYMAGTATYTNEANAITNCNIENFFNPGAFISSGVYNDVNSNTTTITGNKFYQTTAKTYTGDGLHYPIYLNSGGVLTAITNNTIGYNSSNGTGTYTINGALAHRFAGIYINNYSGGVSPPVAGNTITDINYTSASAGNGAEGVVVGIYQKAGNGISDNTISTASSPNTICNIVLNFSVATSASFGLAGASYSYSSGNHSFSFCNIHDLSAIPTTNTIAGIVMGIYTNGSFGGKLKANTIYNLSCGTPIVSPATTPSNTVAHIVTGIRSGSASTQTVERNSVYGLNAISTGNPVITGITNTVGTYQTTIKNNIVRLGADVTSDAVINGINYAMATNGNVFNYHNTVYISGIATKAGGPSNITYAMNFGGDNATTSNSNIRNNIFANQRTNSETGTAKHTAFRFAFTKADVLKVLDYNLYWATPLGRYEGTGGPIDYADLAAWKGTTPNTQMFFTNDVNSLEGNPNFVSSTDLRIKLNTTKVDAVGAAAGVTDDFYGSVRADLTPNDIGAYAYTYASAASDNYRSLATGNWGAAGTWQASPDNANWATATLSPTSSAATVTIQNANEVTVAANATASALTVNGGGKLTLNDTYTLSAASLTLKSDATNGTATVKDLNAAGGLTVTGTTNVEQYLTTGRNWYVSSPVASAQSAVFGAVSSTTNKLHYYNESTGTATPWTQITDNTTALLVGKGYIANMPASGVVTFTGGALNTGNITIGATTLTRTAGQTKEGFNLVGNPYPSYLDWMAAVNNAGTSNLMTTVWYRTQNPGTYVQPNVAATYVFDTYNETANTGTNNNGAGVVTQYIPPMQAFWVRVKQAGDLNSTTGTLALTNSMRSHEAGTNRLKARSAVATSSQQVLRLQVSNGTNSDEAIVLFNAAASNGLDDFDSPKMTNGSVSIPEIYTMVGAEQVVINGLSGVTPNMELPLGFTTGTAATNFSITATEISNFDAATTVVLKDKDLTTEQELVPGVAYTFPSDVVNSTNRFSIIFKTSGTTTAVNEMANVGSVQVYRNANNRIALNCSDKMVGKATVSVCNAVGQKLESLLLTSTTTVLNASTPGVYLVMVTNGGNSITKKVILK